MAPGKYTGYAIPWGPGAPSDDYYDPRHCEETSQNGCMDACLLSAFGRSRPAYGLIGPGTKDRLDLKLDKVFQHQLLLGNTSAGRQALPAGLLPDKAQAFIKGYLFYHASSASLLPVPGVSATHLSGWWVRHACEPLPQASAESRWIMQPRLRWLAPARLRDDAEVMSYAMLSIRLNQHFSLSREALLLFEMVQMKTGVWQEISRGFVVCASWPDMDAAYPGLTHT